MHIYGLLDKMDELTEELKTAAALLHEDNERRKIQAFHARYNTLNDLIRNQLTMISMAMMDTDIME